MADEAPESEVDASEDESEQALLPKSFFAGKDLEIGSKCEVKVEGIYDSEVAVSYVPHKKDKDGKHKSDSHDDDSDESDDTMKGAMSRMDRMAVESAPPEAMGGY